MYFFLPKAGPNLRWNGTRWKQVPSRSPVGRAHENDLTGVAATSASNAWAVGRYFTSTGEFTLVEHWNGVRWKQVASPDPGPVFNELSGVTATSPASAWAAGSYNNGAGNQTLLAHWNGRTWTRVPSPDPGGPDGSARSAVGANSVTSVWAVGTYANGAILQNLALRCC